ncbi:MAG: hypothetical protein AAB484_01940 [Patescibacteria group bacterium]
MSFFSPKSELALIFDIASSSVGAGLVRLARNEPARVIHSIREVIPYQTTIDPDRLFRDMIEVLKKVYGDIIKQGVTHLTGSEFRHVKIGRIFYSFASPWSATQTKTLSIKRNEPFVFTHELLNNLMLDEEEKFKKEAIVTRRVSPAVLSVIERRIIQTRLNGYDVRDPFDKRAREADISYFSGIVPKLVLDKTMEVCHVSHTSKNIKAYTFSLIAYSAIRDAFPKENDFIHIRIGGEISDVSVIEDGLIMASASFPSGQNNVIRKIAENLNMTKEETFSFLNLYMKDHAKIVSGDRSEIVISRFMNEWVVSLRAVLEKLENSMFLPQKLFLIMDGELTDLFVKALETDMTNNSNITDTAFNVTLLDTPIVLISAFAERVYELEKK